MFNPTLYNHTETTFTSPTLPYQAGTRVKMMIWYLRRLLHEQLPSVAPFRLPVCNLFITVLFLS